MGRLTGCGIHRPCVEDDNVAVRRKRGAAAGHRRRVDGRRHATQRARDSIEHEYVVGGRLVPLHEIGSVGFEDDASPVAGDGKIFFASELGKVAVLRPGGNLEVLAVNDLGDLIYATPAIDGGRLYVRTRGALYCFGS